ncbi:MAG: capsular biosynthesis protein CpsI, partial [Desulfobulbaceae bacterium]|nr:capsular biosynthesis protein CpsI [Desulfobulbaceae bacterium]
MFQIIDHVPTANPDWNGNNPDPASSYCPWRVYNIGNNNKEQLMRYIEV